MKYILNKIPLILILLIIAVFTSDSTVAEITTSCSSFTNPDHQESYVKQEDAYSDAWAKALDLSIVYDQVRFCYNYETGYRVAWVEYPYSEVWHYLFSDICDESDGDSVCNTQDNCPKDYNLDQADSDGDGWGDECDGCPENPNKTKKPLCGLGCDEPDADLDGTYDCEDGCPNNPNQQHATAENGCQEDLFFGINSSESCKLQIKKKMKSNPINIINGNNFEAEEDIVFNTPFSNKFRFRRYYNSRSERPGILGRGWTHSYSVSFRYISDTDLGRITDENGRGIYFKKDLASGNYIGSYNEKSKIKMEEIEGSTFVWYRHDGLRYGFNLFGQLIWLKDSSDNTQKISYKVYIDGEIHLESVTDVASGRVITFHYANWTNTTTRESALRLQKITGPISDKVVDGEWVSYGYDFSYFRLNKVTYADDSGFYYGYKDDGDIYNLDAKNDFSGNKLSTWDYDNIDRATKCTTRNGKSVDIYYDVDVVEVTDAYDVVRSYTIDDSSGQKQITDTEGSSTGCTSCGDDIVSVKYDTNFDDSRIIEIKYANDRIDKFEDFDGKGNPRRVILASGADEQRKLTRTYGYPVDHPELRLLLTQRETSVLDETKEKITTWDYDDDYNTIPNENPTPLLRRVIEEGYTRSDLGTIVPYEYITIFTYNTRGQLESINGPKPGDQDKVDFTYGLVGNLLTITYENYDSTGNLLTTTYEDYDFAGNPRRMIDVNGVLTTFNEYDGRNRLLSSTRAGVTRSRVYNIAGTLDSISIADGTTTRKLDFEYYPGPTFKNGLLTMIKDTLGNYLKYDYDIQGNVIEISSQDATGVRSFKGFDYQGTTTNPAPNPGKLWKSINKNHDNTADLETIYGYDDMGNVKTVTDAKNNDTDYIYDYDLFNKVTQITRPGGIITVFKYDSQGNLKTVTDAENQVTTYKSDDMGRVVEQDSPDTGITFYSYDEAGNLKTKTKNDGDTITYQYDGLNRLTNINYTDTTKNVVFTYDAFEANVNYGKGHLTKVKDWDSEYIYTYNEQGYLETETKIVDGITFVTTYTYDVAGKIKTITYPDDRYVVYVRDAAGQVTSVTYAGQTLADSIDYEPFGPMKEMVFGNDLSLNLTFDWNYQLDTIIAGTTVQSLDYTIDDVGNISNITNILDETRNQVFDYDDLYRLEDAIGIYSNINYVDNNGLIEGQGYDGVGNRQFKTDDLYLSAYTYEPGSNRLDYVTTDTDIIDYGYDSNGNTLSVTGVAHVTSPVQIDYIYNPFGQRIKKVVDNGTTVTTIYYHYDMYGNMICEADGNGDPISAYIYLNGNLLSKIDGNPSSESVYYYHNDHLGTPQKMTDATGTVVWAADYDPFGKATVTISTIENNMRFPGQYYDAETGLHYNYHRYYDPETGRYLTPDPIGLLGGINPYVYVLNNPLNLIDPYGLSWVHWGGFDYLDPVGNAAAGFGDFLTSGFGYYDTSLTEMARGLTDANNAVDTCSDAYTVGQRAGIAWTAITVGYVASSVEVLYFSSEMAGFTLTELGFIGGAGLSYSAMAAAPVITSAVYQYAPYSEPVFDIINSMNPGTLPTPNLRGLFGSYLGSKIEKYFW